MRRIGLTGAACIAALAMFTLNVTGAAAAGPHKFRAETYPVTVKANATNDQGFQITGSVSVCKKAVFEGKQTAESETLEVHPKYEQCEVELAGTFKAKVNTTGCNYIFHSANPGTTGGITDIVCEAGKEIQVEVEGIEGGCSIKVPGQTLLKTVEYVNEGTGSAAKVKVNAKVTGIKWSATGACGLKESSGSNGEYREGKFSGLGVPELGTGPATALTEGTTELAAPDGVSVSAPRFYKNSFPGGVLAEGEKLPIISWGTLTLTANLPSKAAPSSCENSAGGFAQNPAGGGSGIGATSNFASWNCTNAGCPPGIVELPTKEKVEKEFIVFAGPEIPGVDTPGTATYAGGSLPWPTELTEAEAGKIRTESKAVVVILGCIAQKTAGKEALKGKPNEPQFLAQPTVCFTTEANKQEPLDSNGSNFGPSQSKVSFDSKSGHLLCKGPTEPEKPGEEITFEGNTSGSLKVMGYKNSEIVISK